MQRLLRNSALNMRIKLNVNMDYICGISNEKKPYPLK